MRPVALLMTTTLLACSEEPAPPAATLAPPPGAVIQIGPSEFLDEPHYVLDTQIDPWVETIALLEPDETRRSHRRKAFPGFPSAWMAFGPTPPAHPIPLFRDTRA